MNDDVSEDKPFPLFIKRRGAPKAPKRRGGLATAWLASIHPDIDVNVVDLKDRPQRTRLSDGFSHGLYVRFNHDKRNGGTLDDPDVPYKFRAASRDAALTKLLGELSSPNVFIAVRDWRDADEAGTYYQLQEYGNGLPKWVEVDDPLGNIPA